MKKLEEDARGAKDISDKLQKQFDIMAAVQVRQSNKRFHSLRFFNQDSRKKNKSCKGPCTLVYKMRLIDYLAESLPRAVHGNVLPTLLRCPPQQEEGEKEKKRLREEKQLVEQRAKEQEQKMREAFDLEVQRLQARMEAANEEERNKLQQEVEKLSADQVRARTCASIVVGSSYNISPSCWIVLLPVLHHIPTITVLMVALVVVR